MRGARGPTHPDSPYFLPPPPLPSPHPFPMRLPRLCTSASIHPFAPPPQSPAAAKSPASRGPALSSNAQRRSTQRSPPIPLSTRVKHPKRRFCSFLPGLHTKCTPQRLRNPQIKRLAPGKSSAQVIARVCRVVPFSHNQHIAENSPPPPFSPYRARR